MNTNFTIAVLSFFMLASLAFGQATTTKTTLATGMTRSDLIVNLVSSTGVSPAGLAPVTGFYIDREYMEAVSNVNASGVGNSWNVRRSLTAAGLRTPHAAGAIVWVSVPGTFDPGPNDRVGACTATSLPYLPVIMVRTGNVITCGVNGQYAMFGVYNESSVGTVIASAATIVVTNSTVHVNGAAAISNIVASAMTPGGTITIIPDSVFTTVTGGNILLGSTTVIGKSLILTFDGVSFSPSY